ncbi:Crp/Fnr family transcriptional regulator [Bacteroides rodentium]|jgi:CRP-like cAMP-binding protein|uniref:Crp/Fnr family transcriptional regulator n=1 Tax=Bacteroides rodentium TaxID=691816 RepID=UPI00046F3A87|nr:Crp/Fnr family transcriptional regulator [Bacteroides rodentium]
MKSKANFNPYIDKIDLNFWRELCVKEGKLCHYKKGEYFLHRRETPKYFGFITSGAFKYTIIDTDGNEHITGLALCDTLAGDFYSSIRKESSLVALQAITDSDVWVCSTNLFRQILKENIELRCVMAEELFRQTHDRYLNLYRQSPKERYWELIRCCPNILQDITLKELASYLQITPTYLSRIRKEITFGKE